MSIMCRIFGHNYEITSALGNYTFCTKCGSTLTIKEPYTLTPGERRYVHGILMEMTEFGLEEVKHAEESIKKVYKEKTNEDFEEGNYAVQSKDPHEQ